jgi:hypothetical protein
MCFVFCRLYPSFPQPPRQCLAPTHGRMNYKDTKPYMSASLSVDLSTEFAAFCLTDFIDWRYIHSYGTCVMLPLYCTFSLTSSPLPPFPMYSTVYRQCVTVGGGGVLKCTEDHILQEFYTLFLKRFRTYKIDSPPQTK